MTLPSIQLEPAAMIMAHQPGPEPAPKLPVGFADQITADVARRHGLLVSDLLGSDRRRHIAHPRQEAWALIHDTGRVSTTWIGRKFRRDHSTVVYGIAEHKRRAGIA